MTKTSHMFNHKTSKSQEATTGMATIIAAGTEIHGNIESKGDIRVDGVLIGNLKATAKVLVGQGAMIKGDVEAVQADIMGKVEGNLTIKELLYLRGTSTVNGNICTMQLQVDATASFNGECRMGNGANVVAMIKETTADEGETISDARSASQKR